MPPSIALCAWIVLLVALLYFDPAKDPRVSGGVWVAVFWMFVVATRLPSQWFGMREAEPAAAAFEEGNVFDRIVYTTLILLAAGILASRSVRWGKFVADNGALASIIAFALLSVAWSDFPLVAFKRWFRDLGNYLMILVVLSEASPLEAVRALLRRLCYLVIPLSIVLIKYFPTVAISYSQWTGTPEYIGATTSKNMLGVMCLVGGLFLFWDITARWPERKLGATKKIFLVNSAFILMTLHLLSSSDSATSRVCLVLGCTVIALFRRLKATRNHSLLKVAIPITVCFYLVLAFGFDVDINAAVARMVGRDPTLTGRTVIWEAVLSTKTNPLIGAGYDSFWLGPRLAQVWAKTGPGINEAHNGYLEVYLEQGLIGLVLLSMFLFSSYRLIWQKLAASASIGSLAMAFWVILPFYNVTESAFKGQLLWVTFLLGAVVVQSRLQVRQASRAQVSSYIRPRFEGREATALENYRRLM